MSQSDLTDEDLLILRYLNGHDRYWAASKLAPLIDIAVVRAAERLEALERGRFVKGLRDQVNTTEPEFCITNGGITAVIARRFHQSYGEARDSEEQRAEAPLSRAGALWPLRRAAHHAAGFVLGLGDANVNGSKPGRNLIPNWSKAPPKP